MRTMKRYMVLLLTLFSSAFLSIPLVAQEQECSESDADADGNCPSGLDPAPTNEITCLDDKPDCPVLAAKNECEGEEEKFMKLTCRKSCPNVCLDGTEEFDLGEYQHLYDDESKFIFSKTIEYVKTTVLTEDVYVNIRKKGLCKNKHSECTRWASMGECEANPSYMEFDCAAACQTCGNLDITSRCRYNETAKKALDGPGTLNDMFERIIADEDIIQRHSPTVLSRPESDDDDDSKPWILQFEDFITEEECRTLIQLGSDIGYFRSMGGNGETEDGVYLSAVSEYRTSYQAWCQDNTPCYDHKVSKAVSNRIAQLTGIPEENSEFLQLLKYDVGQYYKQHNDYIPTHLHRPMGPRILTMFLYLNDVEEGGGTRFPILNGLTVLPKRGRAILWPSVLDNDPMARDDRTDHEALPVEKGIKYGANAWLHQNDFKAAYAIQCQE